MKDVKTDSADELHIISIRLQNQLIAEYKAISDVLGEGYQPIMRNVLTAFAPILAELANESPTLTSAGAVRLVADSLEAFKRLTAGTVPMDTAFLIQKADEVANLYDGDDRQDIKTDILNAFYAGAKFEHQRLLAGCFI